MNLPQPQEKGEVSLEEAIKKRQSVREFSPRALSLKQLSQLLWAAQGITERENSRRSCPSAGALYPLEIYVVVKNLSGTEPGIYYYDAFKHSLEMVRKGNFSTRLADACLGQFFISEAPVVIVICAESERTTWKYGERGARYVHIEAGHCGQNICLQVQSLGLATVPVGAFWDREVQKAIEIPEEYEPLYIFPVGYPK